MKRPLWMRVGARVLANGAPGEIVSVWTEKVQEEEIVNYVDVGLDGKTAVECFRPDEIQRDRIQREVCHV